MTTQYQKLIKKLNLKQGPAGEFLGVSLRTSSRYAAEDAPNGVLMLLELMVALELTPKQVKRILKKGK